MSGPRVARLVVASFGLWFGQAEFAEAWSSAHSCQEHPPIHSASAVRFYVDVNNSIRNPELFKRSEEMGAPLREFLLSLGEMSDKAAAGDNDAKDCALRILEAWANDDALSEVTKDGLVLQTIAFGSLSMSNLKLLSSTKSCSRQLNDIQLWLSRNVHILMNIYKGRFTKHGENNVVFWAAFAALNVGIATEDKELKDWALAVYRRAMANAGSEGYWPSELNRGAKALEYQLFALTPIVMIRVIAERNGSPEIVGNDDDLMRIVAGSVSALTNPSTIEKLAGVPRDHELPGSAKTTITMARAFGCRFPARVNLSPIPAINARDWRIGTDLRQIKCPSGDLFPAPPMICALHGKR
ncbi:MAG: alginate lyase family protein [Alsobacter sp.]